MLSPLRTGTPLPSDRRRRAWSRIGAHVAACALAVTLGTACGGDDGGSGTTTPTPTGTYTLSVAAPTVRVTGFVPTTVPVTITRANGFTGAVSLSLTGLLPFMSATFSPAVIPAGATTSTLTLALAPVEQPLFFGTMPPLTVAGSAVGLATQSNAALQLTLDPGPLTLAASPAALTVAAGASGTTTVAITRPPGSPPTGVTLALLTGPAGVTVSQTPQPSTGATATLTLAVAPDVPAGQYAVVVRSGAFGAAEATVSIPLTVTR